MSRSFAATHCFLPFLAQTFRFTRSHKGTAGGFAVQFGASKDSQTAADTQALAGEGVRGGRQQGGGGDEKQAVRAEASRCSLLRARTAPRTLERPASPCNAGNVSTGAATFCFIQVRPRRRTQAAAWPCLLCLHGRQACKLKLPSGLGWLPPVAH